MFISRFADREIGASNPVFVQLIQRMRWPRRTRDLRIYVAVLVLGSLLLGLIIWRIVTGSAAESGDELLGAIHYGTMGVSFLADLLYVLLTLFGVRRALAENQSAWLALPGTEVFSALSKISLVRAWRVLGIELALRITTIALSIVAIVTFLPPPGFTIGFPLIAALLWFAGLLIVEAQWRMPTMAALGVFLAVRVRSVGPALVIAVVGVFAIRLLHVLVLGIVVYVVGSAINTIASAFSGGPLAAPTAQNFSLLVVPSCLWIATYHFYRALRRVFLKRGIAGFPALAPIIRGRINIGKAVLAIGLVSAAVLVVMLLIRFRSNPGGAAVAEITIFADKPGRKIAADFLGLSFEAPVLDGPYFDPRDARKRPGSAVRVGACYGLAGNPGPEPGSL